MENVIKNINHMKLVMNFEDVITPNKRTPSDCDMWIIRPNYEIVAEIKNKTNTSAFESQKFIYQRMVDSLKEGINGCAIFMVHDKSIENHDEQVRCGTECIVQEYYLKEVGKWLKPRETLSLNDFLERLYYDDSCKYTGWELKK